MHAVELIVTTLFFGPLKLYIFQVVQLIPTMPASVFSFSPYTSFIHQLHGACLL